MSEPKGHWWSKDKFDRPPDARQQRQMAQEVAQEKAAAFNRMEIEDRERDYALARERARLSVLNLTQRDKRFLRAMKIQG